MVWNVAFDLNDFQWSMFSVGKVCILVMSVCCVCSFFCVWWRDVLPYCHEVLCCLFEYIVFVLVYQEWLLRYLILVYVDIVVGDSPIMCMVRMKYSVVNLAVLWQLLDFLYLQKLCPCHRLGLIAHFVINCFTKSLPLWFILLYVFYLGSLGIGVWFLAGANIFLVCTMP
jgi:hypothetical protein